MSPKTQLTKTGFEQAKSRQSFLTAKSLKKEFEQYTKDDARDAAVIALYNATASTLKASFDKAIENDYYDKAA